MTDRPDKAKPNPLSVASKGTRFQFEVAFILVSLLPLLVLVLLYHMNFIYVEFNRPAMWLVAGFLLLVAGLGYALLGKYPRAIIRLREYLGQVAEGEVPEAIDLLAAEEDITAIEHSFSLIIEQMKSRIQLIHDQQKQLLEAERQKVMVESLCTACHHLGQPATAITCYLGLLQYEKMSPNASENLARCIEEAAKLREVLGKLQAVDEYRTDDYCGGAEGDGESVKIIQVEGDKALRRAPWDKIQRGIESFCRAYAEIAMGYDVGTVVQLNDRSIALVHRKNTGSPSEPVVHIVLDSAGNHPQEPTVVDLARNTSLSITRTLRAADPLGKDET